MSSLNIQRPFNSFSSSSAILKISISVLYPVPLQFKQHPSTSAVVLDDSMPATTLYAFPIPPHWEQVFCFANSRMLSKVSSTVCIQFLSHDFREQVIPLATIQVSLPHRASVFPARDNIRVVVRIQPRV